MADRMALFPVSPNPRWRPAAILENFKSPYLLNGSSDRLRVWSYGGVFGDGGSTGATSGWKFLMTISLEWVIKYLESPALYKCQIIVAGDFNIHIGKVNEPDTMQTAWWHTFQFPLYSTHATYGKAGEGRYIVITKLDQPVDELRIDPAGVM